MLYTYLETDPKSGRLTFVGTTNYDARISATVTRQVSTNNGVKASQIGLKLVSFDKKQVAGETCGDCTPKGVFTESVRVEFSSPNPDKVAIVQKLHDMADFIEANPRLFEGLNLQQAADFNFPILGA